MDLLCLTVEQCAMSTVSITFPDQTQRLLSFVLRQAVTGIVVCSSLQCTQEWTVYMCNYCIMLPIYCIGSEYQSLINSTQKGTMSKEELSVSVVRLMKAFIMLGALDPPDMVPYSR